MSTDEKKQLAFDQRAATRAAAAQAMINKANGVKAEWVRESLPDSGEWIAENPDKVEYLKGPGDHFPHDERMVVPYG